MAYGAAPHGGSSAAKRIAALIDEHGKVVKIYKDLKPDKFPEAVMADIAKQEL